MCILNEHTVSIAPILLVCDLVIIIVKNWKWSTMFKLYVYLLGLPNLIILTKLLSIVLSWIGIVKNDASLFLRLGKIKK
jgi:hypothetical protein